MYVGALDAVSNQEDWNIVPEIVDDDTEDPVDLSGAMIVFEVRDPRTRNVVLSATTANGKIQVIAPGLFQVSFSRAEMNSLTAQTYDVGCVITQNGQTRQLIVGTVPVMDGIVTQ